MLSPAIAIKIFRLPLHQQMHPIPPNIRDAINAFEPPDGFIVLPPRRNEKSVIFAYGVRLVKAPDSSSMGPDASGPAIWMCLTGELDRVRSSPIFRDDTGGVYVLMETLRIVNSNLPHRLGEYEESVSIRELVFKDAMQTTINAKVVCHTNVELCTSTKRSLEEVLQLNRICSAPTFTAVADFWTSKVQ
ncbi:unnamed protein product [Phytophthora fragariaefolia]|uniref:Unnamed protein product n=1 Tax=Phytophthora fragariaefolia TaxID=1490495 RepID=A0A9W6Y854_9STRA|nr:unnamed protein product [Phytophthora fragariaefolia]